MTLKWDWHHTLILVGSTVGGALMGYFQSQDPASLFGSLQSWATAKPLVLGALYASIAALLALAKQTFLVKPAPAPSLTAMTPPGPIAMGTKSNPPPPAF